VGPCAARGVDLRSEGTDWKGKGKAGGDGRSVVRRAHTASGATQAASLCLTLLTRVSTG
jgi:hypothetical protein